MVESGMISVSMSEITSRIFIEATVTTDEGSATVTIRDAHTNIVRITENGKTVFSREDTAGQSSDAAEDDVPLIHKYTLEELCRYASTVPVEEIGFIRSAFELNMALLQEGLESSKTTFGPYLLAANGGQIVSENEQKTASLMCNGAIEARVLGLSRPAMSITGSGAHGIIATMPLYAAYKVSGYTEEQLLRATALSYLICMYIKEYSGKLSAFCGCAIAAGTGMACGLAMMRGAGPDVMQHVINNMASSITGMICDGGNQGCTMKGVVAVDAAWQSVAMAMEGVYIFDVHGINGNTPEETMRNMGLIASPGMVGTEKTIVDILQEK
jgi:L-cysteine desulfidase